MVTFQQGVYVEEGRGWRFECVEPSKEGVWFRVESMGGGGGGTVARADERHGGIGRGTSPLWPTTSNVIAYVENDGNTSSQRGEMGK